VERRVCVIKIPLDQGGAVGCLHSYPSALGRVKMPTPLERLQPDYLSVCSSFYIDYSSFFVID